MSQTDKKQENLPIKAVLLVIQSANAMAVTAPGFQIWTASVYPSGFSTFAMHNKYNLI